MLNGEFIHENTTPKHITQNNPENRRKREPFAFRLVRLTHAPEGDDEMETAFKRLASFCEMGTREFSGYTNIDLVSDTFLGIPFWSSHCQVTKQMYPGGYSIEVTCLSPNATEKEVYEFFSHCGVVEYVEIMRFGEYSRTAYVTFKDAYAVETAVLLSGATIADQQVCISHWGEFMDESDPFSYTSRSSEGVRGSTMASSPSEAMNVAQEVVKTLIAKGYVLGKDALIKAKAFDESHQVSSTAIAKVAELSDRIGLSSRINAGVDMVRSVDERYHVTDMTKSAIYATGTTAVVAATAAGEATVAVANAVAGSSYFSKGALWVSDALNRASKAASDLANQGSK